MRKISVSLLDTDMRSIEYMLEQLNALPVHSIHIDITDGFFVHEKGLGLNIVDKIAAAAKHPLSAHLMVDNPEFYIEKLNAMGLREFIYHYESGEKSAVKIEMRGDIRCGIAINPDTPAEMIFKDLEKFHYALIMGVRPGTGGQKLIESTAGKIKSMKSYITKNKLATQIIVDGGINKDNIESLGKCGADIFVAGTFIVKSCDIRGSFNMLAY